MDPKIPELTIGANSWHYRWYKVWLAYHEEWRWRREDFCHYVRVLLFWSPLTWFFRVPVWREVRPWMIALGLAILSGLTIALIVDTAGTLTVLAVIAAIVVAVIALVLVWYFLSQTRPDIGEFLGNAVAGILLGWLYVLAVGLDRLLYQPLIKPWFFSQREWLGLRWTVVILSALLAIWYFLGGEVLVAVLVAILGVTAMLLGLVLVAILLFLLNEALKWLGDRIGDYLDREQRRVPVVRQPKGTSTARLAWEYVKVKKHQWLCPYLVMPGTDTALPQ